MKVYIVGKDAKAYNVIAKNDKGLILEPSFGTFMNEGRSFNGDVVFLKINGTFEPMVKVNDFKLKKGYYYLPSQVKITSESKSGFINGTFYNNTRNYTMGYANPNQTAALESYKDSYPQYSSANCSVFGSFLNSISDIGKDKPNILTQEQIEAIYNQSGSKEDIKSWLNSQQGKDTINNLSSAAISALLNKDNTQTVGGNNEYAPEDNSDGKILGMNPLTFGITSVLIIVGGMIAITLIKSDKK